MRELQKSNNRQLIDIFNRIPLFKMLTDGEKKVMWEQDVNFYCAEEGEVIIREGEVDKYFYVVLTGSVQIIKGSKKRDTMATMGPGEFIGEVTVFTDQPRTASVIAAQRTVMMRLQQQSLESLPLVVKNKIKDKVIGEMANRMEAMNRRQVSLNKQIGDSQKEYSQLQADMERILTEYPHIKKRIDRGELK